MANLFDRAGMSTATSGGGTLALGAALGAVAPNLAGFLSFANAGVADQNVVSYLILDANGGWETGWGVYAASGTTLTRNPTKSSNSNAAISLSGNAQVFLTARAEDVATVEAFAAANIVVNGAMEVSQFNGTNAVTLANSTNTYTIDQWMATKTNSNGMVVSVQQVTPPGSPLFGAALPSVLQYKATTGAALSAADFNLIFTPIEGYRWQRLGFGAANAQAVTIGFWVYATVAGTATLWLANNNVSRNYLANFVINNANTWQWVTVVVPGDTAGTWLTGINIGAQLGFCFGCGATNQGTNNAWNSSFVVGTASTTNFFASSNNLVAVTGVVALPGAHQISQEHAQNIIRPFDQELHLCRRYYEKTYAYSTLPGAVTTSGSVGFTLDGTASAQLTPTWMWRYAVAKRTNPTVTMFSPITGTSGKAADLNGSDVTGTVGTISGETGALFSATASASRANTDLYCQAIADARM
jgi:hypothetical protein